MLTFTDIGALNGEASYVTGVSADGVLQSQSFWTWNDDAPATYGAVDNAHKFGAPVAGAAAVVSFSFDPASHWSAAEQGAFTAGMALWSAEANVRFTQTSGAADFTITRGSDGNAETAFSVSNPGAPGSSQIGATAAGTISIDTSVYGFGPLASSFNDAGGYAWTTIEHELGHILGLGHSGAYDEQQAGGQVTALTGYDNLSASLMSYIEPDIGPHNWSVTDPTGVSVYGQPVTPMIIDIIAIERLYGHPVDTPLSGGQVFGFHSNIGGQIQPFFDFTVNSQPIVTLFDAGLGNTLDLSGFNQRQSVDLHAGAVSDVGGLAGNLTIALETRIDAAVGGSGPDQILANDDGDVLRGGDGADVLMGGAGGDLIFGNAGADMIDGGSGGLDSLYGGQGDDVLKGAGYLSGDVGSDTMTGVGAADTLVGGDGADHIEAGQHALVFGNQGGDYISISSGAVYGGQGSDTISAGSGSYVSGDAGDDVLQANGQNVTVVGGDGADSIDASLVQSDVFGNAGNDFLYVSGTGHAYGGQGDDTFLVAGRDGIYLSGDLGADTMTGGYGMDTLVGGAGADLMRGDPIYDPNSSASITAFNPPPPGPDVFLYTQLADSTPDAPDRIVDFVPSVDTLDLRAIDAMRVAAGQAAFHWAASFDGGAGEAVISYDATRDVSTLMLDADGDRTPDFAVLLSGNVSQGGWLVF